MARKISFRGKIILAVGAHPDDIDFASSGTIAKMIKDGATAYLLILTNGDKGSDDPAMTREKLMKIRQEEQLAAAKIVGFKEVFFLGREDTELQADVQLKEEIVGFIRKLRPDIVFSWDPTFYYSAKRGFILHTDHRAAGVATLDAVFPLSRDRLTFQHFEDLGLKPHKVKTLFLLNFDQADTYFDISATFNLKVRAIKAHKSQVNPAAIEMIKKWALEAGKQHGYKYTEGFLKIDLSF